MLDIWGITTISAKLGVYFGLLTSMGLLISAVLFKAQLVSIERPIRSLILLFAIIGLAFTLLRFSLRGVALTGDISGMVDREMLGLMLQTQVGTVIYLRLAGLGALVIGALIGGRGYLLALAGGAVALWSFDEIGHVPAKESLTLQFVLYGHLLIAAFWIGVFIPLRRLASDPTALQHAAVLGHRFGQIAAFAVPLLIVFGIWLAWYLVGSIGALLGTAYGQALLVKIALVGLLLTLAAMNKVRFVPGLIANDPQAGRRLARSIQLEWVCIAGILLATATFTSVLTLPT